MNNFDRNTRTLIASFVVAIFALIPLRFVEVDTQQGLLGKAQVLGESITLPVESKINANTSNLEAPYDELETCVSKAEVKRMETNVTKQLSSQSLDKEQTLAVLDELRKAELGACK